MKTIIAAIMAASIATPVLADAKNPVQFLPITRDDLGAPNPETVEKDSIELFRHFVVNRAGYYDPASVVVEVTRLPRKTHIVTKMGLGRREEYQGWATCFRVNAKNLYGAYTGFKPVLFIVDPDAKVKVFQSGFDLLVMDAECQQPA